MKTYVLDSFALLAMFRNEPGAPRVQRIFSLGFAGEASLVIAVVNLGEVIYRTIREFGAKRAQAVLGECRTLPIAVVAIDEQLAIAAAIIKGTIRISYADCIAAALAQRLDATLVTGDEGFQQIADLTVEWLPR